MNGVIWGENFPICEACEVKIVGYADRISVRPGERLRFMVSCQLPEYQADMVRLIHGDQNPQGPGFKEELVNTPANGRYPGREQPLKLGSYIAVGDSPLLRPKGGFTLQCWVYPTTPGKGVQGILSRWSGGEESGYSLFVDAEGRLAFWVGGESGAVRRVTGETAVERGVWYFVAAGYDPSAGRLFIYQGKEGPWPRALEVSEDTGPAAAVKHGGAYFSMAAYDAGSGSGSGEVAGLYNGKIDSPRMFSRALTSAEVGELRGGTAPSSSGEALVAAWDFAREVSSDRVVDSSANGLHGTAVNMPARAMTGHNWRGSEINFDNAPEEYGAIHFHDDDLEDAGWEADFEVTVPEGLSSGVYAARLRASDEEGGEDYVPFVVRRGRDSRAAPILLLMPTASYMAYANFSSMRNPERMERWTRLAVEPMVEVERLPPQDRYMAEKNLLSLYDLHSDGSGVCYSSRLRPIMNMRPKYHMQLLGMGRGAPHQFNADLHLVDWLEAKGYEYDVATDEDLNFEGGEVLSGHRVVVTGSHPEYWSAQMLSAMEAYLGSGGRLMYLGGNGFYWITSFDQERRHVIEVRRWHGTEAWEAAPGEYYHSTTGELGGLWRHRGRAPQRLAGVGFSAQGFDYSLPFHRQPDSRDPRAAFIFEGVADDDPIGGFGLVMGGAGGFELDRADPSLGTPSDALVLATTTGFSNVYQHVVEEVVSSDSQQGGTVEPLVKGDMVFFETRQGGAVFSVGSISWCGSLSHDNYVNNVSRITENVLNRFSREEVV